VEHEASDAARLHALLAASSLLEESGALRWAAARLAGLPRPLWLRLLVLGGGLGLVSSLTTNDATVVVAVPIAARLMDAVEAAPAIGAALVTAYINYGFFLLPFGSPQNLLVWHDFRPSLARFVAAAGPLVVLGYAALALWSKLILPSKNQPASLAANGDVGVDSGLAVAGAVAVALVVAGTLAGYVVYASLVSIMLVAVVLRPAKILANADLVLVAELALMVSVFGYPGRLLIHYIPWLVRGSAVHVYTATLLLSQAVSNVPATAAMASIGAPWRPVRLGVDAAGPMLVAGSLTNLIALRLSKGSIRDMHRAQLIPATTVAAILGVLLALK
jgi:Na+/H+ antiporter NhaD/arsenite permease-like protein